MATAVAAPSLAGLHLCGLLVSIQQVTRKDGSPVAGFNEIVVDVSPHGDGSVTREATYFSVDRDTGEATPVATQLAALRDDDRLKPGVPVAVKCKGRSGSGSTWVNLDAVSVTLTAV